MYSHLDALVRYWWITVSITQAISGCDFPAKPVIDPVYRDFVFCHPRLGPSCPAATVCQYRWLGYYVCCNVDHLVGVNFPIPKLTALTFETPSKRREIVNEHNFLEDNRPNRTLARSEPIDIGNRVSINTINDTLIVRHSATNDSSSTKQKLGISGASANLIPLRNGNGNARFGLFEPTAPVSIALDGALWPKVTILLNGDWIRLSELKFQFPSTITLVQDGQMNILIDTGVPTDRSKIIQGLRIVGLDPDQISYLVLTHGHPDHFGNVGLFPSVPHYFGTFMYRGSVFQSTDLLFKDTLQLTPNVFLHRSPGHTAQDITIIVRNVNGSQTVAIVGDLFTNEADIDLPEFWTIVSANPTEQTANRKLILCMADVIIPGHGRLFRVSEKLKQRFKCESNSAEQALIARTTRHVSRTEHEKESTRSFTLDDGAVKKRTRNEQLQSSSNESPDN